MNLPYFIAKSLANNKQASFSKAIVKLATIGTALSVAIMILAIGLIIGFKKSIEHKLLVFENDFHITTFVPNELLGQEVIEKNDSLQSAITKIPGISAIYPYAMKLTILKGDGALTGIRLKGVDGSYPMESNDYIQFEGEHILLKDEADASNRILLSPEIIGRLQIQIGDDVFAYFPEPDNPRPRIRKLTVAGSFHTGVGEIDNSYAICDIRLIQQLNKWESNQISGYQVKVDNYKDADTISNEVYYEYLGDDLITKTTKERYGDIFKWLEMINVNALVLLIIMGIVAVINIATALLIFILERTQMIGIFKSLGMSNWQIQKIFLFHASMISIKGILLGNVIAFIIIFLQNKFKFITLNEQIYYMTYAPIHWDWVNIIAINLSTLCLCYMLMIIPSYIVRTVNIVKALKFK